MDRRETIDLLYRQHSEAVFRYLRSFRFSEAETYDLLQNTFVKLIDNHPETLRRPKAWLFKVARNLAINEFKRNKKNISLDQDNEPDTDSDALKQLLSEEANARLWKAVAKLSESEQELLRLRIEHDMGAEEISTVLGKSGVSVRVAMHRSRKKLKKLLEQEILEGNELPIAEGAKP